MKTSRLEELIEETEFYNMEMEKIIDVIKNEKVIKPEIAKKILLNTYLTKGDIGLTLIPYINCGCIGKKAIECLKELTEIELFKEIVNSYNEEQENDEEEEEDCGVGIDWEHYYKTEKAKVFEMGKEIASLQLKISEKIEENRMLKGGNEEKEKEVENKEKKKPGFFKRLFKGEVESNKLELNVCIIGPCGSGKTKFLKVLVGEKCCLYEYEPTIGCLCRSTEIKVGDQDVKLTIWDTSGEEKYLSLLPIYLRNCKIILAAFDSRSVSRFEKLDKYVQIALAEKDKNAKLYYLGVTIQMKGMPVEAQCNIHEYAKQRNSRIFYVMPQIQKNTQRTMTNIIKVYLESESSSPNK